MNKLDQFLQKHGIKVIIILLLLTYMKSCGVDREVVKVKKQLTLIFVKTFLLIKNCLTDGVYQYQKNCLPILLPEETNSWTWNNARIVHGSIYNPSYKKMLMILEDLKIDWIKYETLLEKSLIKYKLIYCNINCIKKKSYN